MSCKFAIAVSSPDSFCSFSSVFVKVRLLWYEYQVHRSNSTSRCKHPMIQVYSTCHSQVSFQRGQHGAVRSKLCFGQALY